MTYRVRVHFTSGREETHGGLTSPQARALAEYFTKTFDGSAVKVEREGGMAR